MLRVKKGLLVLCLFAAATVCNAETPVTLSTQDGWQLAAVYQPAQGSKKTVVLLHDLGKNKEAFATLRKSFAKNGVGYLALDLRGHGRSTGRGGVKSFAKEGVDNPFNKMTRDVDAAMNYLQGQSVPPGRIVLLGAGLGANVAAKSSTFWPNVAGVALFSPTVNVRDVLSIPPMRVYRGNVLIAAAAADKKMFFEASILRNSAYLTTGEDKGKVTFLTAYDLTSHEMLDKYFIPALLQWLQTPRRPNVAADAPTQVPPTVYTMPAGAAAPAFSSGKPATAEPKTAAPATNEPSPTVTADAPATPLTQPAATAKPRMEQGIPVAPSVTEDALLPSVLFEEPL